MSMPQLETFMARLYTDRPFLEEFLREPGIVARQAGLSAQETEALGNIDRVGLRMAVESFEKKREGHRERKRPKKLRGLISRFF